jgi:hypothetical protein
MMISVLSVLSVVKGILTREDEEDGENAGRRAA